MALAAAAPGTLCRLGAKHPSPVQDVGAGRSHVSIPSCSTRAAGHGGRQSQPNKLQSFTIPLCVSHYRQLPPQFSPGAAAHCAGLGNLPGSGGHASTTGRVQAGKGFGQSAFSASKTAKSGSSQKGAATASLKDAARALADDLRGTSIFLLGMMGSGKSTVGRVLAEALGYYFFDSDEVVEEAAGGATVAQIFEENGEDAFRSLETSVLSELSSLGRVVVSTGGGAILKPTNWSYLQHGITVFLDVPVPVLAARVVEAGTASRPLLAASTGPDASAPDPEGEMEKALDRMQDLYSQRIGLYRNADATISLERISDAQGIPCEDVSAEDVAVEVVASIARLVAERKQRDEEIKTRAGA